MVLEKLIIIFIYLNEFSLWKVEYLTNLVNRSEGVDDVKIVTNNRECREEDKVNIKFKGTNRLCIYDNGHWE